MYIPALRVPKLGTTRKGGVPVNEMLCNCFFFDKLFFKLTSLTRGNTLDAVRCILGRKAAV